MTRFLNGAPTSRISDSIVKTPNTVLPYIDLVNEVLENAVTNGLSSLEPRPLQTTAPADSLRANPQHVDTAAYNTLAAATLPWSLPFNLWHEVREIYLGNLGINVPDLMETFHREGEAPEAIDRAAAYLGLTRVQRQIVTGEAGSHGLGTSEAVLTLMRRSQTRFEELTELLSSQFINPTGKEIVFDGDSCALKDATLDLTQSERDRLHRFRRLQKITGFSVFDLDVTVAALSSGMIDEAFLIQVAFLKRLSERFRIGISELVSLWAPTALLRQDAEGHSLYEKLFLNPAVNNPLNPVEAVFRLAGTEPTELQTVRPFFSPDGNLDSEAGIFVAGALNLTEGELRLLVEQALPVPELNFRNLTHVQRVASLRRALGISIPEYLTLVRLTGEPGLTAFALPDDTLAVGSPEETRAWVERIDRLREPGFTIAELDYILAHRFGPSFKLPLGDAEIGLVLRDLQTELRKFRPVAVGEAPPTQQQLEEIAEWLAGNLPRLVEDAEEALRIVRLTSALSQADQDAFVTEHLSGFVDAEVLAGLTAEAERLVHVYRGLVAFLSRTMTIQRLAAASGLEAAVCEALVGTYLSAPPGGMSHAIEIFLADSFVAEAAGTGGPESMPAAYEVMRRLAKLGLVFSRLGIGAADIAFVFERGPALGWYDIASLPVAPVAEGDLGTDSWMRLARALALSRRLFHSPFSLVLLIEAAQKSAAERSAFLALLAEQTGWELASLDFLTGPQGYSFSFPDDFADERWLERLSEAFKLIGGAGVSAAQIWSWNVPEAGDVVARKIKNAAKARYGDEAWLAAAPELSDALRVLCRDALVDFLVEQNSTVADSDDLYERLLIDPAVQPCFLTSRIKQAISSVQLFVHRIFLGLGDGVRFEAADAAEWLWRKNYRIWEAARKIFLYPENFAEPELRGDKSPFFAELEESLLQGEVTAASVERAYLRYLRSLDEVARLEIAGLFIEGGALVHIFARTVGTPHVYFYRRYVDEAYFTPWEKVDVKIDGHHLLPVVYNRRLWLLWPVFTQRSVEPADLETTGKPQRYWEIKLAWTELSEGKWTSPRTSSDFISTATNSAADFEDGPASHFYFWARVKDGSLRVYPFFHRVDHTGSEDSLDPNQPNGYFRFKGCAGEPTVGHFPVLINPGTNEVTHHIRSEIPYRVTKSTFAGYQRFPSKGKLTIFSDITVANDGTLLPEKSRIEVLLKADQVNGRFFITPPHQYLHFDSQGPFFFEDELETFLIVPEIIVESHTPQGFQGLLEMNDVDLGTIGTLRITHSPALETVSAPRLVLTSAFATGENNVFTSGDERLVLARSPSERAGSSDVSEPHFDATIIANVDADAAEPPKRKTRKRYHFHKFHHPKTCLFIEQLNRFGVDGLLNPTSTGNALELHRQPTLDFKSGGAYSDYNWEVFFHIPLLIADRLSQNQRFEEAQRWYHYIFDPTETDQSGLDPDEGFRKFWKIKPFFEFSSEASIEEIVRLINEGNAEYENEVARWEADPFNPHLVAKLRVVPYMKMVVLKYLDNLIAWADNLFRRDTIESINEATQLYVLAGNILGRKPVQVPGREATARTFQSLRASLDAFSNALVSLENEFVLTYFALPVNTLGKIVLDRGAAGGNVFATNGKLAMMPSLSAAIGASAVFGGMFSFVSPDGGGSDEPERPPVLYFCVPNNQKLLDYFGTLADRLFKIRNCMNIEGVARSLALFEPPINPALLVKAAAAGIDLNSALDDLNAPLPYYRFGYMVQRTTEFCNEVKAVANALLSALEKQDAESLAALRAGHQADLLESARSIKERSIEEAKVNVESLLRAKDTIKHRREFYFDRESTNLTERSQLTNLETANVFQLVGQGYDLAANIAHLIPDFKLGVQGISSPEVTATFGGSNVGQALQVYSKLYNLLAAVFTHKANMAGIKAGHERRKEDWDFQAEQAEKELAQIDRQIVAAEIRVAMAERDLINHDRQIAHAAEEESFLSEKFTNTQLYSRMISQVSTAYFQSYQMAYDLANRAERCFRHELGVENTNFIKFGYWDNLTKGLHAADRLIKDVRRMEVAYIEQNQREYEITQHFSLALLNAQALLQLRENGACEFDIPELAFDLRYPGHYMRRIKSASVTIPCVVGPYTNVNATLSLLRNRVRISGNSQQDYIYTGMEDPKFRHDLIGVQSIATSSGQNDSGLFQLNFQDERYLPFERAGAISRWRLSLPEQFRPFDYNTISDAILHMSYTARDGGNALRDVVTTHVSTTINQWLDELADQGAGLQRLISLKREFPNELHQLMLPAQGQNQGTELRMSKRYFP